MEQEKTQQTAEELVIETISIPGNLLGELSQYLESMPAGETAIFVTTRRRRLQQTIDAAAAECRGRAEFTAVRLTTPLPTLYTE
jgi:hypothetical protein